MAPRCSSTCQSRTRQRQLTINAQLLCTRWNTSGNWHTRIPLWASMLTLGKDFGPLSMCITSVRRDRQLASSNCTRMA
eukprot:2338116-Amphidinium_carterae.1